MQISLLILVSIAILLAPKTHGENPFTDNLLKDADHWSDGKAEISIYDATEVRYGKPRETEIRHIVVTESFAPDSLVKADDWRTAGARPVIKLNQVIRVPTGSYRYDQMHSSFWSQDNGSLVKFSLAGIDSCGNTYKEGRIEGRELEYEVRTYWEGMDRIDQTRTLPEDALFYDELPFKLRLLDWENASGFSAPVFPSVVSSRADALEPEPGKFVIATNETTHTVTLSRNEKVDVFIFEKSKPHRLIEWQRSDGGSLRLRQSGRLDYWNHNQTGDEEQITNLPAWPTRSGASDR